MKWLCPLPTAEPGLFLFVRCTGEGRDPESDAVVHLTRAPQLDGPASPDSGERQLLTSAVSFLAPSDAADDGHNAGSAPSRRRPTAADLRRRAAALVRDRKQQAKVPKGDSGGGESSPDTAAGASPPPATATQPGDLLSFALVDTADGGARAWSLPAPVAVGSLVPPGMAAAAYCRLLDHLLRQGGSGGGSGGSLKIAVCDGTAGERRVELLLSVGARASGAFLLATVELRPKPSSTGSHRPLLGQLLAVLSAHVAACNGLQLTVDRQAAEIAALRRALAAGAAGEKAAMTEQALMPLCDILNAKKEKIRQLTAEVQRSSKAEGAEVKAGVAQAVKAEPAGDVAGSARAAGRKRRRAPQPPSSASDSGTPQDSDEEDASPTGDSPASDPAPAPSAPPLRQSRTETSRGGANWVKDLFEV